MKKLLSTLLISTMLLSPSFAKTNMNRGPGDPPPAGDEAPKAPSENLGPFAAFPEPHTVQFKFPCWMAKDAKTAIEKLHLKPVFASKHPLGVTILFSTEDAAGKHWLQLMYAEKAPIVCAIGWGDNFVLNTDKPSTDKTKNSDNGEL